MKKTHLLLDAAVVCLLAAGLSAHAGDTATPAERTTESEPQPTKFATLYNVRPVRIVAPVVPQEAVQRGLKSGEITLSFDVTPDGHVREVRVVRANPEGVFDDAFVEAGKRWVFKKSKSKWDEPVYFEIVNSYRFKLDKQRVYIR
jgi:TonB family protein